MKSTKSLQPDVKELVLCQSKQCACDTYVFEPAPNETSLGYLLIAGEVENSDDQGQELFDHVITAVQKEYYRTTERSALSSFESALRQANLILAEKAETGQKNWMNYFNVAIAVLEDSNLHVSVAGAGNVLIGRKLNLSNISIGLAQFPITNPLNTFSQVASGNVMPNDTVWLGTSGLAHLYTPDTLAKLSSENSAATIASRMQDIYRDKAQSYPLATTVISIFPNFAANSKKEDPLNTIKRPAAAISPEQIKPRQPLEIKKSNFKNLVVGTIGLLNTSWHKLWPILKKGSIQGKDTLFNVSKKTHKGVTSKSNRHMQSKSFSVVKKLPSRMELSQAKSLPGAFFGKITNVVKSLPRTSKIFALITILLAIALITSLVLLQKKRTADETIQRASEILHEAETKEDAADMALIYNNREQASIMLADAEALLAELEEFDIYTEKRQELAKEIQGHYDRLNKITRADMAVTTEIGDFGNLITQKEPTNLFFIDKNLYTFNPENNTIVKMDATGKTNNISSNTQGIGFFTTGVAHQADKRLILSSDNGTLAIFDAANETLRKQDVDFAGEQPNIQSISVFGTRLYAYDKSVNNILSLSKTLRGYSNDGPWIKSDSIPKDNIVSIAVDGNIFTLHDNGTIHRLFKGDIAEFKAETVEPDLASATRIITGEEMNHVYVVDPPNQRVVIYDKTGTLIKQILLDSASQVTDIAIGEGEKTLYVLDGTKVLQISLEE